MRDAGFEFVFIRDAVVNHKIEPHNYSLKFLKDRQFRAGIEMGQLHRLKKQTSLLSKLPPWKIVIKAILHPLLLPVTSTICSKQIYYKFLFGYHRARGFFKGWRADK